MCSTFPCSCGDLHGLTMDMLAWEAGSPHRTQHLLKVWSFARLIAAGEELSDRDRMLTEAAALVHDIGIVPALEKYGSSAGPLQEKEGREPAREALLRRGFGPALADEAAEMVAHHHTPGAMDTLPFIILLEADMLVNLFEGGADREGCRSALEKGMKTLTGRQIFSQMFGIFEN